MSVPVQHPRGGAAGATVGVVVAAYEAASWIAETLESLRQQTYPNWYCVVVDDGSSDETAAIAEVISDSRISVVRVDHAGVGAARNFGTAALDPDVRLLSYLDSDDTLLPDAFAELVALLDERPDAVGAYGLAEYVDAESQPLRPGEHPRRQRDRRSVARHLLVDVPPAADLTFDELVVNGPIWPTGVALLRRDIVEEVGGWNPAFTSQQDWDLYIRMSRRGSFAALDRQVAWYRRHNRNTTSQGSLVTRFQAEVRVAAYNHPTNTAQQRATVARAWRYLSARQAVIAGLDMLVALGTRRGTRARQSGRVMLNQLRLMARVTHAPPHAPPMELPMPQLPAELHSWLRTGSRLLNFVLR